MPDTAANPLVEQITAQLHNLSVDELHAIQNFVAYIAWKRRSPDQPPAPKKSAEARAIKRIPDLDDPTQLANYCALEIDWEGDAYKLTYRIYEVPTPKRVLILSFAEHDPAYDRAVERKPR